MTQNIVCECLYRALCISKSQYNREAAKNNYKELIAITHRLNETQEAKVTHILNTARKTLENLHTERIYRETGMIGGSIHNCTDEAETLETIQQLKDTLATTNTGTNPEEETTNTTENETPEINIEDNHQNNIPVTVSQIIDHRFRDGRLKLKILIRPGNIELTEDYERVLEVGALEIQRYIRQLSKRRLSYLYKREPHIIRFFQNEPQ